MELSSSERNVCKSTELVSKERQNIPQEIAGCALVVGRQKKSQTHIPQEFVACVSVARQTDRQMNILQNRAVQVHNLPHHQ
jgi:hypothetical protein